MKTILCMCEIKFILVIFSNDVGSYYDKIVGKRHIKLLLHYVICSVYKFMFFNCDNITLYHNCLDCLSICWLNDNTQKYLTLRCYFERTARQMNSLTSLLETESTWTACLWVAILSCRIMCTHVVFLLLRSHHEWRSAAHATPPIVSIQRAVIS